MRGQGTLRAGTLAALLVVLPAPGQACSGDCNGDGTVAIDELVRGVGIALGSSGLDACPAFDTSADDAVSIAELIAAVDAALTGCPSVTPTPTATPSPSPPDGSLTVAEAVARDATGVAVHLGQRITTAGVVTVDAATFANSKLKVFVQDGGAGIMVYHQTSAAVDAFAAGQRLRVTGVVGQFDPTAGADNRGQGTVLVDITHGSWMVLSDGNPLPEPVPVTLADIAADGIARVGTLVRLGGLHKVSGEWPTVGDRTTQVLVGDASGGPNTPLRLQRLTITPDLVGELTAIGDGPFDATAIVVQDDPDTGDGQRDGFELWPRGADDIES
jgi:hypothetical protein